MVNNNAFSSQDDFQQIIGLDIINLNIDKCNSANAFRVSAVSLLTSQDLYLLLGSIEDALIDTAIRQEIRVNLHHNFAVGQLHLFADSMFSSARSAPSEYYTDYYYTLYQAATILVEKEEYLEFTKCYQRFANDNSDQAVEIRTQLDELQTQAELIHNEKVGE